MSESFRNPDGLLSKYSNITLSITTSFKTMDMVQAVTRHIRMISLTKVPAEPKKEIENASKWQTSKETTDFKRSFVPASKPVVKNEDKDSANWPRNYVARVFSKATEKTQPMIERKLKRMIGIAQENKTMWTVDWESLPMPDPHSAEEFIPIIPTREPEQFQSVGKNKKLKKGHLKPVIAATKSTRNSPKGQSKLSTREPEQYQSVEKNKKLKNIYDSPIHSARNSPKSQSKALQKTAQMYEKERESLGNLSKKERKVEMDKLELRKNRFEQEQQDALQKMKKKQVSPPRRELMDMNLDSIDWNEQPIIGTCAELEKPYLRLTSTPDPSTVRPLKILKQTLDFLKKKWVAEHNYTYICDQFKSLRQDVTVQRIKNEFTVLVYETHSRIAIEKGDLGEFNQCSAQLKLLYTIHNIPGCEDEFTAYRILYMIHTKNNRDLIQLIGSLDNPGPNVRHALQVRSSLSSGNYYAFFDLYHKCPNMGGYLMDHFLDRERLQTFLKLVRAYRPTISIQFLAKGLGFALSKEKVTKMSESETCKWIKDLGISIEDGCIDSKSATAIASNAVNEVQAKGVDIKGQIH